jgi:hypothetical protein
MEKMALVVMVVVVVVVVVVRRRKRVKEKVAMSQLMQGVPFE